MAIIDPTTSIGKLRLRCGDFSDLPIMPDNVYQSALDDCEDSLPRAAVLMCQYILATLTCKTHRKLAQLEVYGNQWFEQYLAFVKATLLNPMLMQDAPIPYGVEDETIHPIAQFQRDWNRNYSSGTQSDQMEFTALGVFDGTTYGF